MHLRPCLPLLLAFLPLVLVAADGPSPLNPAEFDAAIRNAEAAYEKAASVADAAREKAVNAAGAAASAAKREAAAKRSAVYEERLRYYTKQGDFDRAKAVKDLIEKGGGEAAAGGKPKDAVRFDGHTYSLVRDLSTWHVAKRKCEEMGGHLIIVNSPKEADFARRLTGTHWTWAGATDEEHEGRWTWIDGTPVTVAQWMPGQPDNGNKNEHYLSIRPEGWNDWPSHHHYFICEWDN